MAMLQIEEPRVRVTESIHQTPNLLDIDSSSNVGGVIVAPRGPRLAYVSGPADFLKKYTVDGEVPRNADKTFINAYYLSFSAGLVLARSMNTQAVEGLVFSPTAVKETKIALSFDNESIWGVAIGSKYYWCYSGGNWEKFKSEVRAITNDDDTPKYENTIGDIEIKYTEADGALVKVSSVTDLASKLQAELKSGNDNADAIGVTYSSLVGGLVITGVDNEKVQTDDTLNINVTADIADPASTVGLKANKVKFKDGAALTKTEYLVLNFTNDKKWAFTFGTLAYYHGPIDKSKFEDYSLKLCTSVNNIVNSINGIKGMSAELVEGDASTFETNKDYVIRIDYSDGNKLYTGTGEDLIVNVDSNKLNYTNTDAGKTSAEALVGEGKTSKYTDGNTAYDSGDFMFAIYADAPQDSDIYHVNVRKDDGNLFMIGLSDGQTNEEYTVSLLADELDQSGSNAFIENLNALGLNFTIITNPEYKIKGSKIKAAGSSEIGDKDADTEFTGEEALVYLTPKATQTFAFGDSGLSLSACKETACITSALYELEDQEQYDIEYLAPFGMTDLTFIKNYVLVGKNNDWFTPVDIPYQKTNANSIKGYFLNVDDTSNAIGMGPFDKNTGLTGWLNYIACSTLYYTKIYNNKAQRKEFAPVFDLTNGILDFTNPVYMIGKEDRVKLLNFRSPVNFLIYDMRHNCYYLNDNRTHQPEVNIVSEEQNRRIVNKIKKDLKRLLGRFKGRYNTVTTRNDVISQITLYFTDNIMNQEYAPSQYQIICDETNNTDDMIAANQLGVTVRVQLYNSIKFVDVLVDVFPLNVSFEQ